MPQQRFGGFDMLRQRILSARQRQQQQPMTFPPAPQQPQPPPQPQVSGGRGSDFGFDPTQPRISGGPVSDPMQPQMMTQPPAPNPYSQQVGQEDPRMQAMRNMSMMRF
jgi:hypothetical protein